jgi:hypothetical protein
VALSLAAVAGAQQKFLILHDLPHAQADPTYLKTNQSYLDTLPIDGLAVYVADRSGNNVTGTAMQPTAINLTTMQSVLSPLKGLSWKTLKQNFGLLYYGPGWADAYDDAKWAIVAQNAANFAQALKDAGLVGIFFDNENYSRYGNYGDATCTSPHTVTDCQSKMIARGNQVMKAMMSAFPNIVVFFLRDTYISDNTFYSQPQFSSGNDFSNNIAHANLLVGPFQVGFVQAAQGTPATVVGGGEDPGFGAKTPADFDYIYQYQKYGQVNDALAGNDTASRSAGPNGYIPPALRSVWPNIYNAGVAIYDLSNMDPKTNMPTTLSTTITNALNRVDRYAWLYMEVWAPGVNPPHPSMLIPPGSAPDAAPQAWVDAVRAGRAAVTGANQIVAGSINAGSITTSSAAITWTTTKASDSVVEYGPSTSYGQSASAPSFVTAHSVSMTGLSAGATYHYRVRSTDSTNVAVVSGDMTFTTSTTSRPVPPPSGSRYVSDLTPTSSANGWGPVEKDMSNGEQGTKDGHTISIRGVKYAKGLGAHAVSDIKYAIPQGCSAFNAVVGIDDEVAPSGSVIFRVLLDGVKAYDSGVVNGTMGGKAININIAGHTQLELAVADGGDGINYDHADWANAQLTCSR